MTTDDWNPSTTRGQRGTLEEDRNRNRWLGTMTSDWIHIYDDWRWPSDTEENIWWHVVATSADHQIQKRTSGDMWRLTLTIRYRREHQVTCDDWRWPSDTEENIRWHATTDADHQIQKKTSGDMLRLTLTVRYRREHQVTCDDWRWPSDTEENIRRHVTTDADHQIQKRTSGDMWRLTLTIRYRREHQVTCYDWRWPLDTEENIRWHGVATAITLWAAQSGADNSRPGT